MNDYLNSENDSFDLLGYYYFFSIFGNEIVKVENTATRRFFFIFPYVNILYLNVIAHVFTYIKCKTG